MRPEIQILGMLIPIIAITLGCGIPLLYMFLDYRKRKEMFALYHQERMAAIEKGVELTPLPESFFTKGWFDNDAKPPSPHGRLLAGLVWLFIGLAALAVGYFHKPDEMFYALVPIGIGAAYLIYYFSVGRREAEVLEAEQRAKAEEKGRV